MGRIAKVKDKDLIEAMQWCVKNPVSLFMTGHVKNDRARKYDLKLWERELLKVL